MRPRRGKDADHPDRIAVAHFRNLESKRTLVLIRGLTTGSLAGWSRISEAPVAVSSHAEGFSDGVCGCRTDRNSVVAPGIKAMRFSPI
ncbi:hypothetical protein MESS2_460029 [Mesorhizobium metallidurans STM 2683]|uniref:Uncharacterized protein n=1 Tax=Mesorhizobium metallidurans STM 2683 TaxID=1297569 RepID=M5F5E1_9HYPH|nr:hypothetical protein MESS2_460029 [Mesorhizobium metallidurans STM 2683]